jgi:integrase
MRAPKVPPQAPRCYDVEQLRALVSDRCRAESESLWLFLCLVIYTGARASEVQHLRWRHVHLDAGMIEFEVTKNGHPRAIPLQPELVPILRRLQRECGALGLAPVWSPPPGTHRAASGITGAMSKAWLPPLFAALGIVRKGRVVHDMRHTHAALMVATGESAFAVQHNLGHLTPAMTGHYSRAASLLRHQVDGWPRGRLVLRDELAKVRLLPPSHA